MLNAGRIGSLSRPLFFSLLGFEVSLLIAFLPLVGLLDRYVMSHGGVDILIAVLPIFVLAYLILIALLVGTIAAGCVRPEKGKHKLAWWASGFLGTILLSGLAANLFGLCVAIAAPLLWTLVIVGLANRQKGGA
jgi:hypothetical protein